MRFQYGARQSLIQLGRLRVETRHMFAHHCCVATHCRPGLRSMRTESQSLVERGANVCAFSALGEPDASGRRRPIPVEGSEFVLDVDTVIMSLGTSPNPLIRSTTPGLETNKKGGIIVDENEMSTRENVFAGGDAVTGAATVILAMGAGKKAAEAIDRKLQAK